MSDKEQPAGEIDFTDGELSEMGVELAGREGAQAPRKSRSMLRVPVDEVPRPQGPGAPAFDRSSTEPSLPAMGEPPVDLADEVVEHAFRNGGVAEGEVPATLHLAAQPARDEMEIFSAQLMADRDRERVIELQMDEADTDSRALGQPAESETGDEEAATRDRGGARINPALAALARAVAVPSPDRKWLTPTQTESGGDKDDAIWSSAPPPEGARAAAAAALIQKAPGADDSADDMELEDGELEEVETPAPPVKPERQRTMTPVVPPPPLPTAANGDGATHAIAIGVQPSASLPPSVSAPIAAPPAMPPLVSAPHAVPPMPPTPSGQHAIPPAPPSGAHANVPPAPPASAPMPPTSSAPIHVNGNGHGPPPAPAAANGAHPAIAPALPVGTPPNPAAAAEGALRPRRKRRAKQWFEEIFDDDYLRTLPFLTPRQTERESKFVAESLQIPAGGTLLDLACGYGRHAMELASNGYKVTGLDLSLPLLIRAADAARRVGVNVNFIHGDMREMTFENEFDGAYCMFTSFGYFDDDTNRKVAANLARAIKPGGKLLLDVVNRDYLVHDLPTRVWWQGDGCVVLEEVDFNYFSSRLQVQRSIIFEDGRQVEQDISIRAYSLHEIGKVLHHSGFRVTEVSGGLSLRGKFFGADSRQLIVVAEKKLTP